ncbi:hypothetical protein [Paludibacterium purpuratum]|uniref:Uncharacterized protein n=1 Tax=Paludibacterium purpuratum TaxID=1144873 RepID=A0A4R7AXN8_9NEIS|nr:hypothetical protein [Paludibacterium purpuratum]TDR72063.1 hypothetical protein DFP86_11772 [Paludibacterium purpuratum]
MNIHKENNNAKAPRPTIRLAVASGVAPCELTALPDGWQLTLDSAVLAQVAMTPLPPRPERLEAAIQLVEDRIAPLGAQLPANARWQADSPLVRQVLAIVSPPPVSRAALEQVYQQLADSALGRPWPRNGQTLDAELAATLLILRELMHHLAIDFLYDQADDAGSLKV